MPHQNRFILIRLSPIRLACVLCFRHDSRCFLTQRRLENERGPQRTFPAFLRVTLSLSSAPLRPNRDSRTPPMPRRQRFHQPTTTPLNPMKLPCILVIIFVSTICPLASSENAKATEKPISKVHPDDVQDLKIGDAAPDFSLLGIDDKRHTLTEYRSAKVFMVAFLSNHCPDSHGAEARIKKLVSDLPTDQFKLVAINPNNQDGLSLDELGYSKYNGVIPFANVPE